MQDLNIPEGYQSVIPYIIIENAAAFLDFMKNVFNAEEMLKYMRSENVIMHAEIKVSGSIIMFADTTEQIKVSTAGLFIYVADADETYKKALANGATAISPLADQSYGRSGGVRDPFGNDWWITTNK